MPHWGGSFQRNCRAKFEADISLSFDALLFSADLARQGTGLSKSLVGGGMPVEKAAALAGLMEQETEN